MFTHHWPHVDPGMTKTWSLSQETLSHPSLKFPGGVFLETRSNPVFPTLEACACSVTIVLRREATAWVAFPHPCGEPGAGALGPRPGAGTAGQDPVRGECGHGLATPGLLTCSHCLV